MNICGLVKSDYWISYISFWYWLIYTYLLNPLYKKVSIILKAICSAFIILILFLSPVYTAKYEFYVDLIFFIPLFILKYGILFKYIYLSMVNEAF